MNGGLIPFILSKTLHPLTAGRMRDIPHKKSIFLKIFPVKKSGQPGFPIFGTG
jgi:hypothetical protein